MKLRTPTQADIDRIKVELENTKKRKGGEDFLVGFPAESVAWYEAELERDDFAQVFLFWDDNAWGNTATCRRRRLEKGVNDFIQADKDPAKRDVPYLKRIKEILETIERGVFPHDERFLVLVGEGEKGSKLIIDGNHRAAAILWWAIQTENYSLLPTVAWLGLSPRMKEYPCYSVILKSL